MRVGILTISDRASRETCPLSLSGRRSPKLGDPRRSEWGSGGERGSRIITDNQRVSMNRVLAT